MSKLQRFSIGDHVRAISDSSDADVTGSIGFVIKVDDDGVVVYSVDFENHKGYYMYDHELEYVKKTIKNVVVGDVLSNSYETVEVLAVIDKMVAVASLNGFNDQFEWMRIDHAESNGWKLKQSEIKDEKIDVTLADIADKFDIDIKKLRIKE